MDAVVGVASSSEGGCSSSRLLWTLLRMCVFATDVRNANSCALRRGGGRKGEPGEGKGEVDGEWSTERERRASGTSGPQW